MLFLMYIIRRHYSYFEIRADDMYTNYQKHNASNGSVFSYIAHASTHPPLIITVSRRTASGAIAVIHAIIGGMALLDWAVILPGYPHR